VGFNDLGFLFFVFTLVRFLHRRPKVADTLPQAFAKRSELARSEQQESNGHDKDDLSKADFSFHLEPSQIAPKALKTNELPVLKILGYIATGVKTNGPAPI
jgi:hypothetical protein